MGLPKFLLGGVRKFLLRGANFLAFKIFSKYADCQLGGGSQENVSIVSARGGVPKWAFLASADMWMTPYSSAQLSLIYLNIYCVCYSKMISKEL